MIYKVQVNMTKTVVIFYLQILFVTNQSQENPCDENPCGKYAVCQQFSSGSFLCKCDRNGKYPVGTISEKNIKMFNPINFEFDQFLYSFI